MNGLLNAKTAATIRSAAVSQSSYVRKTSAPGVLHLGLGAFHRAHQAMVFDALLDQGDPRWGVMGVAMRSPEVAAALDAQDGLYSVQVAGDGQNRWHIVRSLWATCVAALEPQVVVAALAAPATRWVTLTVTEKGYTPALARLVVQGLAQRWAAGLPGLTVASCDNLSGNGDLLRALCLSAVTEAGLEDWIIAHCTFPNSMVDRIVPAATAARRDEAAQALGVQDQAALATEGFWEWVLEDHLADPEDAQALRSVGVTLASAVKPFEDAKLRMLNGSHTAMACMGAVLGLPTISECVGQPGIHRFVHGLMTHDVMPQLLRPDTAAYRDALLKRFANPQLRHSVHQIATDSSKKIPQRWVPAALAQLAVDGSMEHLALAAAAWMRYCLGEDQQGIAYALNDPEAALLQNRAIQHCGDAAGTVAALMALPAIWGEDLPGNARWCSRVTHWLARIHVLGVLPTLDELNVQFPDG